MATPIFEFSSDAYDKPLFTVVELRGTEAISTPYEFELVIKAPAETPVDLQKLLVSAITLTITYESKSRFIHGIVSAVQAEQVAATYQYFRIWLSPPVWRLAMENRCAVYLDKTYPEIIEEVLNRANLAAGKDYDLSGLIGKYAKREFTCQYIESDLAFIMRLMEHEGIYFHFEQTAKQCKLSVADGKDYLSVPDLDTVTFSDPGLTKDYESIMRLERCLRNTSREVTVVDYNYRQPSLNVTGSTAVNGPQGDTAFGIQWQYDENVLSPEEATHIATIRAEEAACWATTFHGVGAVPEFRGGFTFKVQGHPDKTCNTNYLLTEIRHSARNLDRAWSISSYADAELASAEAYYSNRFVAVSADAQYRPRRLTAKPRIAGYLNGHVYSDVEDRRAPIDSLGRYRVVLPFVNGDDPTQKVTCWMRMSHPSAGPGRGSYTMLRSGAEVVLAFFDGDPDRPFIIGTTHNGASRMLSAVEGAQL
ncbi:MAG: type VI secretion system Vgr family protein [Gammaproteobacteria bacterium]